MHSLNLSFAKRQKAIARHAMVLESTVPQVRGRSLAANLGKTDGDTSPTPFWQKRYYDRNVRDEDEFTVKLCCLHRNSVARGLVRNPADWKWSSFSHYALREKGPVEIESQWTATDRGTGPGSQRIFLNPG
jgi:hypothetical protein